MQKQASSVGSYVHKELLQRRQLLFFFCQQLIDLFDIAVGQLLDGILQAFGLIFRQLAIFLSLAHRVDAIPPDVADRDSPLFG